MYPKNKKTPDQFACDDAAALFQQNSNPPPYPLA